MNTQNRSVATISAEQINTLLPQTQCTQCGYAGCRPYAEALAQGSTEINRCPPGGQAGVHALARLLQVPEVPLDTGRGSYGPLQLAVIDEDHCIGCTLCIQACPVDAIVGANLRMHTVVATDCTGCKLCIAPCPVDCISMVTPEPEVWWQPEDATRARQRYEQRQARLAWLEAVAHSRRPGAPAVLASTATNTTAPPAVHTDQNTETPAAPGCVSNTAQAAKQAAIQAALARARARRQQTGKT